MFVYNQLLQMYAYKAYSLYIFNVGLYSSIYVPLCYICSFSNLILYISIGHLHDISYLIHYNNYEFIQYYSEVKVKVQSMCIMGPPATLKKHKASLAHRQCNLLRSSIRLINMYELRRVGQKISLLRLYNVSRLVQSTRYHI